MADPDKASWRATLLAARAALTTSEREAARSAIAAHVLRRAVHERWTGVAAYEPLRTEPGSRTLLTSLHARGVRVLVPITLADRDLDWTTWSPDRPVTPLAVGGVPDLGRDAIAGVDVVLVPALAAARDGTRLGRGGGSYDRALGRRRPGAAAVALLFADEVVDALPADAWDVPVDAAVTPDGWLDLRGNAPRAGAC